MEYAGEITNQLESVDRVLASLGRLPLQNNPDFVVDDTSWEKWLKINYSQQDRINLAIIFSPFGIQIDLDRIAEAYSIGQSDYEGNQHQFEELMIMILTSMTKVEYCGSNFTTIEFYDSNQKCRDKIKHIQGLYLRINCEVKEYEPIY